MYIYSALGTAFRHEGTAGLGRSSYRNRRYPWMYLWGVSNLCILNESAGVDKGAGFRQIQQRYEPHPGTLRAIEIIENSPTYSERPQPTAHASRDRAHHPQSTWNGIKENSER